MSPDTLPYTCDAVFLFEEDSPDEVISTLESLGAQRIVGAWQAVWMYPDGSSLLHIEVMRNIADWESDLDVDAYEGWLAPLKRLLGSEPTAVLVVTGRDEQAPSALRNLTCALLGHHHGLVHDTIRSRLWQTRQFVVPGV